MFAAVYAAEGSSFEMLLGVGRDFSPRIETCGSREIVLDLAGLTRLFGDAKTIADELRRTAADRGLRVRIAIAGTRTAARLLAHNRAGITIVDAGNEAAALAALPLVLLARISHPNDSNDPNASNDPNDLAFQVGISVQPVFVEAEQAPRAFVVHAPRPDGGLDVGPQLR
jgi:phosphatidylserine/phosphatidylglycerophosphate/cardiolipin synthase-like enzyme